MPPALEIHRPDLMGSLGLATRKNPPRLAPALEPPLLHQTRSPQHPLETALTGHFIMHPLVDGAKLPWTPLRMRMLQPHYLTHHSLTQLPGMAQWPTRNLLQSFKAMLIKSLPPLIPRLGADLIFLA